MVHGNREEISGENKREGKAARRLRLSDSLRGPFDIKSFALTGLLVRIRMKPAFGAAIVLLSLAGLVIYGISRLAEPAAAWLEKAPYSLQQLKQKLLPLKSRRIC